MHFQEKMRILIRRKGYKKTEFAEKIGITYRALANYLSGSRKPKDDIMKKIETELGTNRKFLYDDRQNLVLNSEERFIYNASEESTDIQEAADFLEQTRKLFNGKGLTEEDKQMLFSCMSEIYFDAKGKTLKK